MEELCEEFYKYNSKKELLPLSFIKKYTRELTKQFNVSEYVKKVEKGSFNLNYEANYNFDTRYITIFYQSIKDKIYKENKTINSYDFISLVNTQIIHALTHECIHALQSKKSDMKDDSIESNIFFDSINIYEHKSHLYLTYYDIFPIETNAEILGKIISTSFINLLADSEAIINNNKVIAEAILDFYIDGTDIVSPTALFYILINEEQRYDYIMEDKEISNYKRMLLGLPLKDNYFNELIDIKEGITEVKDIKKYLKTK